MGKGSAWDKLVGSEVPSPINDLLKLVYALRHADPDTVLMMAPITYMNETADFVVRRGQKYLRVVDYARKVCGSDLKCMRRVAEEMTGQEWDTIQRAIIDYATLAASVATRLQNIIYTALRNLLRSHYEQRVQIGGYLGGSSSHEQF